MIVRKLSAQLPSRRHLRLLALLQACRRRLAAVDDLRFTNYGLFAVVAFLGYEHLLTLDVEVALFWKKQFNGASLLFFVNRYLTIAWAIATAASPYYGSNKSCMQSARGLQSVECFLYFPWAVFSALRVYALGRTWPLAVLVFVLSMMPDIVKLTATFCIMLATGDPDHSPDCRTVQGPITRKLANTFTIMSRTSLIAAEVIVLVVTWITTYRRGVLSKKAERNTMAHVVLFNGTTYFLVMVFLNCLQLGFTLATVGPTPKVLNVSEVTTFSEPITSVLITRFLFDLQRANRREVMHLDSRGSASRHSEMAISPNSLQFRGVLNSLGSVLVWETEVTDDDTDYAMAQ